LVSTTSKLAKKQNERVMDIPVILTPLSGDIDPPTGSRFKEHYGLTILPLFS
jgi:hypothetical protein